MLLKNWKPLDLKLLSIGSVISCVQIARPQKTTGRKNITISRKSRDFRKAAGQSNNLVLPLVGKAIHNGNWDKHHTKKKHICRLCYYLLLKSKPELLHNFVAFKISQHHFWALAFLRCNYQRLFNWSKKKKIHWR